MKYIIFAGSNYYPCGGFLDHHYISDNMEQSLEVYNNLKQNKKDFDWCDLYRIDENNELTEYMNGEFK